MSIRRNSAWRAVFPAALVFLVVVLRFVAAGLIDAIALPLEMVCLIMEAW